jgi:hypothetical protein
VCDAKHFQQCFKKWSSGNNNIDKFIKSTQLSAHKYTDETLEWIPYDRFCDIKCIAKGGFGKIYRAKWVDGRISKWDNENKDWERVNQNMFVILKSLTSLKNDTLEKKKV